MASALLSSVGRMETFAGIPVASLGLAGLALVAGAASARWAGLRVRDVAEAFAVTAAACVVASRPVSVAIGALTGPASGSVARGWEYAGLLGHSSLCPAIVAAFVLPLFWRLRGRGDPSRVLALAVVTGALGYTLLKLLCFHRGCCFGDHTFGLWAVRFSAGSDAAAALGAHHWVHPVQLYDAFAALAVASVGWLLLPRAEPLRLACTAAAALLLSRIALEPFRWSHGRDRFLFGMEGLTENALLCGAGLVVAFAVLVLRWSRLGPPVHASIQERGT